MGGFFGPLRISPKNWGTPKVGVTSRGAYVMLGQGCLRSIFSKQPIWHQKSEFVWHKSRSSYAIKVGSYTFFRGSLFIRMDIYAIRPLILWYIVGSFFLLMWGVGVVEIVFIFSLTAFKNAPKPNFVQNLSQRLFLGAYRLSRGDWNLSNICPNLSENYCFQNF